MFSSTNKRESTHRENRKLIEFMAHFELEMMEKRLLTNKSQLSGTIEGEKEKEHEVLRPVPRQAYTQSDSSLTFTAASHPHPNRSLSSFHTVFFSSLGSLCTDCKQIMKTCRRYAPSFCSKSTPIPVNLTGSVTNLGLVPYFTLTARWCYLPCLRIRQLLSISSEILFIQCCIYILSSTYTSFVWTQWGIWWGLHIGVSDEDKLISPYWETVKWEFSEKLCSISSPTLFFSGLHFNYMTTN